MRIARCRLDLSMAEQLADHREPLAGSNGGRGRESGREPAKTTVDSEQPKVN